MEKRDLFYLANWDAVLFIEDTDYCKIKFWKKKMTYHSVMEKHLFGAFF